MKESKFISPLIKAKLFYHHNEKSLTILLSEIERLEESNSKFREVFDIIKNK